jgi:hypothetical protein
MADQKLTIAVTAEQAEAIKASATTEGITVPQYLHKRIFGEQVTAPATLNESAELLQSIEAMLRYTLFVTNRCHIAIFSLAQAAKTLSTEELDSIYADAVDEAVEHLGDLSKHMEKLEARMAAATGAKEG